jgi:hypothetical protein
MDAQGLLFGLIRAGLQPDLRVLSPKVRASCPYPREQLPALLLQSAAACGQRRPPRATSRARRDPRRPGGKIAPRLGQNLLQPGHFSPDRPRLLDAIDDRQRQRARSQDRVRIPPPLALSVTLAARLSRSAASLKALDTSAFIRTSGAFRSSSTLRWNISKMRR